MLFVMLLINHPSSKSLVLELHSYLKQFFKPLPTPMVVGLLLRLPAHQPWLGSSTVQRSRDLPPARRHSDFSMGWDSSDPNLHTSLKVPPCLARNVFTDGVVLLFSHAVVSDSLRPHGRQHTSLPCPSLSP